MRCFGWSLFLTLLVGTASAAEFRVSGVFGRTDGPLAALVETAEGRSRIVRAGDELAGGRIVEVRPEGVLYRIDQEERLVRLRGGTAPRESAGEGAETRNLPPRREAAAEIARAETRLSGDAEQDRRLVAETLGLPRGARVAEIDRRAVADAGEVLRRVRQALEEGSIPALGIEGGKGPDYVYLIPADAGQPTEDPSP